MTDAAAVPKVATKRRVLVDSRIIATAPAHATRAVGWQRHESQEARREAFAKAEEAWCREFEEFVRDHRSQDAIGLEVVRVYEDRCSACNATWETMPGDDEDCDKTFCANCGVEVTP